MYDYNARYYSAYLNRFVSPDTIIPNPGDPQSFNRYMYARGNPIKYTDASGHCVDGLTTIACVIAVGAIVLKVIDYGWTAYDAAVAADTLADPNASVEAKQQAATDLAMAGAFELAEPDDWLPVGLPLDDLARHGIINLGGEAAEEAGEQFLKLSTKESWGNLDTLEDHFRRHGADFGAQSADEYANMASEFFQLAQKEGLPTKVDDRGITRVYDPNTNTFGSYNPDGTTKTFYKPDPAKHKLPTNMDYWNKQPGNPPWTP